MALSLRRAAVPNPPDPFDPPVIIPLQEDADFARESALLSALESREKRRKDEIERLELEGYFASKPSGEAIANAIDCFANGWLS